MGRLTSKKVGAVSFLNTKPLIYPLLQSPSPDIDLSLDYPSLLADKLQHGQLDVALIPTIEYFRQPNYRIIPNISISSKGTVGSILLFSQKPIADCRTVRLDSSSRTSQALVQILLGEYFQIYPDFVLCPPTTQPSEHKTDAVLLIGDQALRYRDSVGYALDLGQIWQDLTDLPFVYACWVGRSGGDLGNLPQILDRSKQKGLQQIDQIAQLEAKNLGLPVDLCHRYLTQHIFFDLGEAEVSGLREFYRLALKYGLAKPDIPISFLSD